MKIAYLAIIPMASLALLGCGSSSSETPAADAGPTTSDAQPEAQAPVDAGSEAGSGGGNSGAIALSTLTPKT
ncbi:MAG TPA: hypothetical protein VH137_06745, partial [Gemmatimonadales bacterium]|nr:hypothetical protein [Gemmatimonadales bacterium]